MSFDDTIGAVFESGGGGGGLEGRERGGKERKGKERKGKEKITIKKNASS